MLTPLTVCSALWGAVGHGGDQKWGRTWGCGTGTCNGAQGDRDVEGSGHRNTLRPLHNPHPRGDSRDEPLYPTVTPRTWGVLVPVPPYTSSAAPAVPLWTEVTHGGVPQACGGWRGNPHLWGTWVVAVLGTCSGGWARVGTGGHRHSCHTHRSVTRRPHRYLTHRCHTQTHTESQNSMSGRGPLVMIQPNPCPGHLEQVTLVWVGWDVSVEGDSALSLGSCPRASPFHDGSSASY